MEVEVWLTARGDPSSESAVACPVVESTGSESCSPPPPDPPGLPCCPPWPPLLAEPDPPELLPEPLPELLEDPLSPLPEEDADLQPFAGRSRSAASIRPSAIRSKSLDFRKRSECIQEWMQRRAAGIAADFNQPQVPGPPPHPTPTPTGS